MDELTITDIVYIAMAVRAMLEKDLNKADRDAYEKLWYKCKISHKGQKIRELFTGTFERFMEQLTGEKS